MLYGSAKIQLNDLSSNTEKALRVLSLMCRDLYNVSTRTICDHYEQTGKVLNYQQLKQKIQNSNEYQNIGGKYFMVMLTAIADFKKYISTDNYILRKSDKTLQVKNLDKFFPPKLHMCFRAIELKPPYLDDTGCLILPSTQKTSLIKLPIPEQYQKKDLQSITIRPLHHVSSWELIITYPVEPVLHSNLDPNHALGIDLGITNFATCADSLTGNSFIIDGRRLKSMIQGYYKYFAKHRASSGGNLGTKRIRSLCRKFYHQREDYVRKTAAYIIRYCIENNIGHIVLGWGVHFQQSNLGINNRLYKLMPFAKLKDALAFQCKKHGIRFSLVDECFTSQASFIDLDPMPKHISPQEHQFSGKRIKRGLYMSGDGIVINADVNGAFNILRKAGSVELSFVKSWQDGRGITSPKRIDPLK